MCEDENAMLENMHMNDDSDQKVVFYAEDEILTRKYLVQILEFVYSRTDKIYGTLYRMFSTPVSGYPTSSSPTTRCQR